MTKLSGQTKTSQNCSSSFKLCRCPVFFPLRLHSILRPLPKAKYRAQGHFNFLSAEGLEAVITERECQKREWIAACLLWKFAPYVTHEGHFHPRYERDVIDMRLYIRNKVKYDPSNAGKPLIFVEFPDPRAFTVGQVKEVSVTARQSILHVVLIQVRAQNSWFEVCKISFVVGSLSKVPRYVQNQSVSVFMEQKYA